MTTTPATLPEEAAADPRPRLPAALVVGPQKAGTTWIHEYLAARGDVSLPRRVKETFFFDRHWERGAGWYADHFPGDGQPAVEVGPTYFHEPEVPHRVAELLGPIPIVATLRDPVRRTWSLYLHMLRYGMTRRPFLEAVREHPELLESSRYAAHLARWRETVGAERVHVLVLDDLGRDPALWADPLADVLELPRRPVPESLRRPVNEASLPASWAVARAGWRVSMALRSLGLHGAVEGAKKLGLKRLFFGTPGARRLPEPTREERELLRRELGPEVDRTEELLGRDLPAWRG
jgi:hypothetical protein